MGGHWPAQMAMSEEYLDVTYKSFQYYNKLKEKFFSDIPVWITESADAGCGGNTWATTYLDVIRTINELGVFSNEANGVIFHNTLASSDYGWLSHDGYQPRPNYFAVLLWSRLMGDRVYKINEPIREGCHVFAHSRKDGKNGVAYAIVNNSKKNALEILLPKKAECYILSPNGNLRSETMLLNGRELALSEDDALPDMSPIDHQGGSLKLNSGNCAFIVL